MSEWSTKMSRDQLIVACILKTLRSMPEADRDIFMKKHYRGWDEQRIALSLGLAVNDVRESLQRSASILLGNLHPLAEHVAEF
ncbi:MAG: hypothetical protein KA419_00235 [Acidobacteria bacterium]|nr:hypothetical protein [Acidobacteriota bacterium]